ncbi:MAG: glycosyltransferase family 2 protein [Thiohalocapsa sp.]
MPKLSIIIPTRRLHAALAARIRSRLAPLPDVEVLIVEPDDIASPPPAIAGSPATELALPAASTRMLRATRGRGTQCNAGARAASGELLLFLHDDTELPPDALTCIGSVFEDPRVGAACFRLRFDHDHWLLGLYAACSRFESVLTTFGDQGLMFRRDLFDELGGFPDWPLFEDVELARRARRRSGIVKLPATVTTSAIRFERNGILRQQLLNAELLARFLLGARPEDLATRYEYRRG